MRYYRSAMASVCWLLLTMNDLYGWESFVQRKCVKVIMFWLSDARNVWEIEFIIVIKSQFCDSITGWSLRRVRESIRVSSFNYNKIYELKYKEHNRREIRPQT